MTKTFLCLMLLMSFSQSVQAEEKASAVLSRYGFKAQEIAALEKKIPELDELIISSEHQTFVGPEYNASNFTLKLYDQDSNDIYTVMKSDTLVDVEKSDGVFESEIKRIEGEIRGTLYDTLMNDVGVEKIATQMSEAFKEDFSTTKGLRTNASYSMDVRQYYENGRLVKQGSVLQASLIIGHALSKKILKIDPETFAWKLLSEDYELSDKPFYAPVRSSRVSSLFQLNRRHPVTRKHQPHNGIDFVAPSGTPVYPALEGEVVTIARTRSKGKFVTILHDNGYQTTYIHLKKFQKGLRVGMRVSMEDQIGQVGRTGYATGAHLHFGVIRDGFFVNPIYLVKSYCYDQKDQHENMNMEQEDLGILEGDLLPNDEAEE